MTVTLGSGLGGWALGGTDVARANHLTFLADDTLTESALGAGGDILVAGSGDSTTVGDSHIGGLLSVGDLFGGDTANLRERFQLERIGETANDG